MEEQLKVLLIEDDSGIVESVSVMFQLRWPEVKLLSTMYGEKGVEMVQTEFPDIVILDLGLPDTDGFQVLRRIRSFSDVPVVILTVMGEEINKIRGLELGADDYVVKPFSPGEFLARVRAVIRRMHTTEATGKVGGKPFIRGKLRIDFASQEVCVDDKPLKIGPREYDLLHQLVTNEGKELSNEVLLETISEPGEKLSAEFIRVLMKRLKEKVESETGHQNMIVDEGGTGYKFITH
ncbi:response regulator transcription factor [Chloroflexota bacterium]